MPASINYFLPLLCVVFLLSSLVPCSSAITCYECDSAKNFTCTEFWDPTLEVTERYLTDCSHVFEATHCIKMTGIFEGKLGTKRFCSSKTWGNYCEYIQRPGDIQEYRSCVFSCALNGCNAATPSGRLLLQSQGQQMLLLLSAMTLAVTTAAVFGKSYI